MVAGCMTRIKESIIDQLERRQLYRRLIVLFGCCLISYVSVRSMDLLEIAIINGTPMLDFAAAIASSHVPPMAAFGFVSKLYWEGKINTEEGKYGQENQ